MPGSKTQKKTIRRKGKCNNTITTYYIPYAKDKCVAIPKSKRNNNTMIQVVMDQLSMMRDDAISFIVEWEKSNLKSFPRKWSIDYVNPPKNEREKMIQEFNKGDRIISNQVGETVKLNIFTDDFNGMLREFYNFKNTRYNNILIGEKTIKSKITKNVNIGNGRIQKRTEIKKLNVEKVISPYSKKKWLVNTILYIMPLSSNLSINEEKLYPNWIRDNDDKIYNTWNIVTDEMGEDYDVVKNNSKLKNKYRRKLMRLNKKIAYKKISAHVDNKYPDFRPINLTDFNNIYFGELLATAYKKDDCGLPIKNKDGIYEMETDPDFSDIYSSQEERYNIIMLDSFKEKFIEWRIYTDIVESTTKDLHLHYPELIDKYVEDYKDLPLMIVAIDMSIASTLNEKYISIKNGFALDKINEYCLHEWSNVLYNDKLNDETNDKDSCIIRMIKSCLDDPPFKLIKDLKDNEVEHGIQLNDYMEICKKYDIDYKIYNLIGDLEYSNNIGYGNTRSISCIYYNNHVYPIRGKKLYKCDAKQIDKKIVNMPILGKTRIIKSLTNLIENRIIPFNINLNAKCKAGDMRLFIKSFETKDTIYTINEDYDVCKKILDDNNMLESLTYNTSINDLPDIFEKHYFKKLNILSFIPNSKSFNKAPIAWKKNSNLIDSIDHKKLVNIDKNKSYPYSLLSLPFLIVFDYRKHKIIDMTKLPKNERIINKDYYLYLAQPRKWSFLMMKTELYSGYYLKDCKKRGIKFDLLEELECDKVFNHYADIVDILFKSLPEKDFKTILNIFIGKFERAADRNLNYKFKGFMSDNEIKMNTGYTHKLFISHDRNCPDNILFDAYYKINHIRNKFPIAIQIKDMAKIILFDKIKELNILSENIFQVNTDSISYYGNIPNDLDKDCLYGWKLTEFNELADAYSDKPIYIDSWRRTLDLKIDNNNPRILHNQYAGCGKTTYIINELIPKLIEKNISYIVLTPSHCSKKEYSKLNIPCDVIQTYEFNGLVPEQQYIIIDEIGMISTSGHDFLYKLTMENKSYECFGDFKQLLPIGERLPSNQPHYLKYMFSKIYNEFKNYRNNFSQKFYDRIINGEFKRNKSFVYYYSTDSFWEADRILCYRKCTRRQYNINMLKYLGYKNIPEDKKKLLLDNGIKLISKTQNLMNYQFDEDTTYDIYNKKEFTIIDYNDETEICKLIDEDKKIYELPYKLIYRNFDYNYAINIHQAQGMTVKSYYYPREDRMFIDQRVAYTVISRLYQVLIDKKID